VRRGGVEMCGRLLLELKWWEVVASSCLVIYIECK
jgi:hypothetical protein